MYSSHHWRLLLAQRTHHLLVQIQISSVLSPRHTTAFIEFSLDNYGQVHAWMNRTENVEGANRVKWPDLDSVAIHIQV